MSCKPTSNIITSKTEAQKRGIYRTPENNGRIAARSSNVSKKNTNQPVSNRNETRKIDKRRQVEDRNEDDYVVNVDNSSYMIRQLINAAEENLGADYRTGGTTPEGFDCSGLMFSTFRKFDITLPRSSNDMAKIGRKLNNRDIQKGDLIFFRTNGKSVINHVGMVTEVSDDEIKFIHSSTQKGVIISSTKEPYYERTFAQANRILE
jgi:lipoprotein Spr